MHGFFGFGEIVVCDAQFVDSVFHDIDTAEIVYENVASVVVALRNGIAHEVGVRKIKVSFGV